MSRGIVRALEVSGDLEFDLDDSSGFARITGVIPSPNELSLWSMLSVVDIEQYKLAKSDGDYEKAPEQLALALAVASAVTDAVVNLSLASGEHLA